VEAGNVVIPTDKNYKAYIEPGHRKFYFQHLSAAQQQRLIDLLNQKAVAFEYPGYFYQLPYFIQSTS
jgi:hypothetical protein